MARQNGLQFHGKKDTLASKFSGSLFHVNNALNDFTTRAVTAKNLVLFHFRMN